MSVAAGCGWRRPAAPASGARPAAPASSGDAPGFAGAASGAASGVPPGAAGVRGRRRERCGEEQAREVLARGRFDRHRAAAEPAARDDGGAAAAPGAEGGSAELRQGREQRGGRSAADLLVAREDGEAAGEGGGADAEVEGGAGVGDVYHVLGNAERAARALHDDLNEYPVGAHFLHRCAEGAAGAHACGGVEGVEGIAERASPVGERGYEERTNRVRLGGRYACTARGSSRANGVSHRTHSMCFAGRGSKHQPIRSTIK